MKKFQEETMTRGYRDMCSKVGEKGETIRSVPNFEELSIPIIQKLDPTAIVNIWLVIAEYVDKNPSVALPLLQKVINATKNSGKFEGKKAETGIKTIQENLSKLLENESMMEFCDVISKTLSHLKFVTTSQEPKKNDSKAKQTEKERKTELLRALSKTLLYQFQDS
jgi:hypothetical protein